MKITDLVALLTTVRTNYGDIDILIAESTLSENFHEGHVSIRENPEEKMEVHLVIDFSADRSFHKDRYQ